MKQVIIRIRDVDGKLRAKEYFTTYAQYLDNAVDYIENNLGCCYEVELKVGNQFRAYKLESDFQSDARFNLTSFRQEIDSWVTSNAYYVEQYLPRY